MRWQRVDSCAPAGRANGYQQNDQGEGTMGEEGALTGADTGAESVFIARRTLAGAGAGAGAGTGAGFRTAPTLPLMRTGEGEGTVVLASLACTLTSTVRERREGGRMMGSIAGRAAKRRPSAECFATQLQGCDLDTRARELCSLLSYEGHTSNNKECKGRGSGNEDTNATHTDRHTLTQTDKQTQTHKHKHKHT